MSNIIDSIQLSGVTYTLSAQTGGGDEYVKKSENIASAYTRTYEPVYGAYIYSYGEKDNKLYFKFTNSWDVSTWFNVYVWTGSGSTTSQRINFTGSSSTSAITNVSTTSTYLTATVEDGVGVLTLNNGYYWSGVEKNGLLGFYFKDEYSSGQSKSVIEDTIYPVLDDLTSEMNNKVKPLVNNGSLNYTSDGSIVLTLYKNETNASVSAIGAASSTINTDGGKLNVQFTNSIKGDKTLNTGNTNYCDVINVPTYDNSLDSVTITFNSGYTGSDTYDTLSFRFIDSSNARTYTYAPIYIPSNNSITDAIPSSYATVTDTLSTDYKLKVVAKDGYRICRIGDNCKIAGTDMSEGMKSNYTITLVTTESYVHDGQEVIDDLYANKQDTLSAGTGIQISGNVISATGGGGGGNPTVELTQAEYDALVSAGTVSADTFYIITDATPVDMSQYWTSAQTQSAITQATSGKVNTSSVVSSVTSASTDSEIPTAKAVYDATQGGGGGGTTYTAGRGIDITNDTISVSLPISAGTGSNSLLLNIGSNANGSKSIAGGQWCNAYAEGDVIFGQMCSSHGPWAFGSGNGVSPSGKSTCAIGEYVGTHGNLGEAAFGCFNNSSYESSTFGNSGNTLFSVGNGTRDGGSHNALEIRQNGDIYLSYNGNDVKLQDLIADIYSKLPTS